jgi:serine/threonine protein kinase
MIIMKNPGIGLVPTFGLFYCGRKGDMFCVDKDGKKIDENNSIFIVQEKKNAKPLSVVKKFTKEMLIQLFEILVKLEENGIYHCDINNGNILVDETNNDKIYLIDFGLASFMINKKRIYQRTTYFSGVNDSTAFDDFFAICSLLSSYNRQLYQIIYSLLETIIKKFRNPKIKEIHEIETTFSFYLEGTEEDWNDKIHNLKIYNEYKMKIIYESVKKCLEKALADKP